MFLFLSSNSVFPFADTLTIHFASFSSPTISAVIIVLPILFPVTIPFSTLAILISSLFQFIIFSDESTIAFNSNFSFTFTYPFSLFNFIPEFAISILSISLSISPNFSASSASDSLYFSPAYFALSNNPFCPKCCSYCYSC